MKAVVTGGAGFIGSHLVDALLARGDSVVVIDDFSRGLRENIEQHTGNSRLVVLEKDVRACIPRDCDGADCVFHLAADPRVRYSVAHPEETRSVNVDGTIEMLLAASHTRVSQFVFSSSCAVYGTPDTVPISETACLRPLSPYAKQKKDAEESCVRALESGGFDVVILRYFNVIGPRQNPSDEYAGVVPKFVTAYKNGNPPTIFGDGTHTRDFVAVEDVVRANLAAATLDCCFGEAYNIGSGISVSVNHLASRIKALMSAGVDPVYGAPVDEPAHSCADVSKARKELRWEPNVSFDEALRRAVRWFSGDKRNDAVLDTVLHDTVLQKGVTPATLRSTP